MAELSVLIVDDEKRLRELLVRAVERLGFDADAVATAEAAETRMTQRPRDIVVLDLNLPGKSGTDFMDDLRRRWPATRVIILTGFGDLASAQKAVRHNLADYVTKPFDLGDIDRALDRARRQLADAMPGAVGSLASVERQAIIDALDRHDGNRSAAARHLGISRRTLYNKIEQYRLQDGA